MKETAQQRGYNFTSDDLLITSPLLDQYAWLKQCCTTRDFSPPDARKFEEVRDLQALIGLPPLPICYAQQKHTTNVGVVRREILDTSVSDGRFTFKETDAIVCGIPNVTVAIFTADCTPVFLVDPTTRVFALIHAGWKGTFGRICEATVEAMNRAGAKPADIVAWIGPSACQCCYEVSPEMIDQFRAEFCEGYDSEHCFNGRHLDLVEINRLQLLRAGLSSHNVALSGICTIHEHNRFYSYRADNKTNGRIVSMMTVLQSPDE